MEVAVVTEDLCQLGEKFCVSLYGQPINPQNQSINQPINQSTNHNGIQGRTFLDFDYSEHAVILAAYI